MCALSFSGIELCDTCLNESRTPYANNDLTATGRCGCGDAFTFAGLAASTGDTYQLGGQLLWKRVAKTCMNSESVRAWSRLIDQNFPIGRDLLADGVIVMKYVQGHEGD